MNVVRIKCRVPEQPQRLPGGIVVSRIADWTDTSITLVDDEGREHEVTNVAAFEVRAEAGPEPIEATLRFVGVELDIEAVPKVTAALREDTPRALAERFLEEHPFDTQGPTFDVEALTRAFERARHPLRASINLTLNVSGPVDEQAVAASVRAALEELQAR